MVAAWHADYITVMYRHCFVQLPVVGIETLDAETLGRVDPVIVGLFQIGDAWKIDRVMTARRARIADGASQWIGAAGAQHMPGETA